MPWQRRRGILPLRKKNKKKVEKFDALVLIDENGLPFLSKRQKNVRFGGLWGPPMGDIDTSSMDKVGEISHHLSHRELQVTVWRGACSKGIDPESVPISNLDRRILEMAMTS